MRRSGSTTTLVDSTVCIRVSQATARTIVKEAAAYPGESIAKIIRRVVDSAPELHFTPEHAEIVRMAGQSQVSFTKIDARIKPGASIDLYAKFVASIEKKALRDLTEQDAEAQRRVLSQ